MKQYLTLLLIGTMFISLQPDPTHAHNGAVAIAVPIEGIVVDGDLSDWPSKFVQYPLFSVRDDTSKSAKEYQGVFRIGYNEREDAVYIAIEVLYESHGFVDCIITIDVNHNQKFVRYWSTIDLQEPINAEVELAASRDQTMRKYEWRIDMKKATEEKINLQPDMILGLDVRINNENSDGTFSQISWAKRLAGNKEKTGDLVLVRNGAGLDEFREIFQDDFREAIEIQTRSIKDISTHSLFPMGLFIAFFLLHFILFIFYPQAKEHLWFALFAAASAVSTFAYFRQMMSTNSSIESYSSLVFILAGILSILLGLRFLYSLFCPILPRQYWLFVIGISIPGFVKIMETILFQTWGYQMIPLPYLVSVGIIGGIVFCAIVFEMLRLIVRALRRRETGTWIVGCGFVTFVPIVIYNMFILREPGGSFSFGLLGLLGSMSVYLARSVAQTSKSLEKQLIQIEELSEKTIEQERTLRKAAEKELQTAHDLQMGLMPKEPPKISGLGISSCCLPANHVGGDFFHYFPLDEKLAISLADITGHAMEAAIPAVMFDGILKTEMRDPPSLETLFSNLNYTLCELLDKRTFVCFTMGELDTDSKKFRLSNGGCPYPYHYKAASGEISELQVDAYPLGVRAETDYPVIILSKPPALPGDSQSLTVPEIQESLPIVNRSKFNERKTLDGNAAKLTS